jgi:two-component system CheB/CheR fusion protein
MGVNNILADIELETLESEALEHTLEDILAQTSELSKTIDDFRNFFKPERVSEEVFVADVYADAYKVIEKSLYNNNIEVSLQNSSTLKVQTFSRELMQVFINLLNNAKDALLLDTRLDKKIFVTIEDKNNSVIIQICDNGGGVDSAIKERIFEPYFSTKEASSGTGLGLYMSKTILEKHLHSTIECLDVDEGACFEIVLHTL